MIGSEGRSVIVSGVGRMGRRHVLAAQMAGLRVVGLHDTQQEVLARAASELDLPAVVVGESLAHVLEATGSDIVIVSSTADAHFETCREALEGSIRMILCEKPFVRSVHQAETLRDMAVQAGAILAVNHQSRVTTRFAILSDLLNSGLFGALDSMSVVAGNIGLAMGASHYIDFFRMFTSSEVSSVRFLPDAIHTENPRGGQFHDPAGRLIVEMENGRRLFMDFGANSGHGLTSIFSCQYGRLVIDDLSGRARASLRYPEDRSAPSTRYGMSSIEWELNIPIDDPIASTAKLWRVILAGASFPSADDGVAIIRTLAAAERSGELDGRPFNPKDQTLNSAEFRWA